MMLVLLVLMLTVLPVLRSQGVCGESGEGGCEDGRAGLGDRGALRAAARCRGEV